MSRGCTDSRPSGAQGQTMGKLPITFEPLLRHKKRTSQSVLDDKQNIAILLAQAACFYLQAAIRGISSCDT